MSSSEEDFKLQSLADKIAKEENEKARELRDAALIGRELAQMENADIKKQNDQIDQAGRDANSMAQDVANTNERMENARKYSCASRKWLIIGIIVAIAIVVVILIVIAIIIGVLVSK